MKEEKEKEEAILICDFLEIEPIDGIYHNSYKYPKGIQIMLNYSRTIDDLHFINNWQWLMEVVLKIEKLNYTTQMEYVSELGYYFRIYKGYNEIIKVIPYETKIKSVYKGCINFIKRYNSTK